MCGPKFCSMHHSRTIDEGIARLAREAELAIAPEAIDQVADLAGAVGD